jgi:hypothetical protein
MRSFDPLWFLNESEKGGALSAQERDSLTALFARRKHVPQQRTANAVHCTVSPGGVNRVNLKNRCGQNRGKRPPNQDDRHPHKTQRRATG